MNILHLFISSFSDIFAIQTNIQTNIEINRKMATNDKHKSMINSIKSALMENMKEDYARIEQTVGNKEIFISINSNNEFEVSIWDVKREVELNNLCEFIEQHLPVWEEIAPEELEEMDIWEYNGYSNEREYWEERIAI